MIVLGRDVVEAGKLKDIPRLFRALPGCLAMTSAEIKAYKAGDPDTVSFIDAIAKAENYRDALYVYEMIKKRAGIVGPSVRMAMLRTVNPGRRRLNLSEF